MRDFRKLNLISGNSKKPLNKTLMHDISMEYGFVFPESYIQFLEFDNSAPHPERDTFFLSPEDGYGIDYFFSFTDELYPTGFLMFLDELKTVNNKVFPFAKDGGVSLFCFRFFQDGTYDVGYLSSHYRYESYLYLAASFESFIDQLQIDPDMI